MDCYLKWDGGYIYITNFSIRFEGQMQKQWKSCFAKLLHCANTLCVTSQQLETVIA